MEVQYHEAYIRNSRGVHLFTCRWLPLSSPKALVFLCHALSLSLSLCFVLVLTKTIVNRLAGYGMECGDFMRGCGTRLARYGYAVFGIDYEGHGRSMGAPRCYIHKFDNIVTDCTNFFKSICAQEEYRDSKRFLYGESMGGAVALLVHKKDPTFWHGAVLVAPMCKITEKVKPHPVVVNILTRVEEIIPKWKIVPTKDVIDSAFKDPAKREEIRDNKLIYQGKPRLKTALEMLRASMSLEESLGEASMTCRPPTCFPLVFRINCGIFRQVRIPFFVLHGEADTVTEPEVSRALHEQASSKDKTLKLYPGMWHGLTSGEPDVNIEMVFSDIISWLDKRSGDDNALSMSSIVNISIGGAKLPTTRDGNRPQRTWLQSRSSYLCRWRGRRSHHHSAM